MPAPVRYFEDYPVGTVLDLGSAAVDRDELIAFAQRYDPQPFHVDPQAARASVYGGLIASGWMTGSLMMRRLVEAFLSPESSLGSPGIDELRWLVPVRPGDILNVRATVLEATPSRSKPDRGVVRTLFEALNQNGEVVMSMKAMNLLRREPRAG